VTAGGDNVTISGYKFTPGNITVKVATTVTWTNHDQFDHSVVEDDQAFTGTKIHQGASYTHTYDKAGTYSYHCGIHNFMTATVTVTS
jgi:plastocyanin